MKYVAEGKRLDGGVICRKSFDRLEDAVNWLTNQLYDELGDGDGENGGRGSLRNCEGDIRKTLAALQTYGYAECRFKVRHMTDQQARDLELVDAVEQAFDDTTLTVEGRHDKIEKLISDYAKERTATNV